MKVAIVILNWNGIKWLQQFLPDVVKYSPAPAEVWIADNGSSDDSLPWVRKNLPSVRILEIGENRGYAGGYNYALKYIQAPVYVLLNSDVAVTKNWLDAPLACLASSEKIGAVQPKVLSYFDPEYFEYAGAAGGMIDHLGYPFCRGRLFYVNEKDEGQFNEESEIFWASGAALFVKQAAWEAVSGLDEDFFAHMEEIDLCWRMKNIGYSVRYVPESVVYHVGGGTLSNGSPRKIFLNFRNNLYLLLKNLPAGRLLWLLPLRLTLDGLAAIRFLTENNGLKKCMAVARAHFSFYGNLGKMWKKRKNIPTQTIQPMFMGSVVWNFFVLKRRHFHLLKGRFRQ